MWLYNSWKIFITWVAGSLLAIAGGCGMYDNVELPDNRQLRINSCVKENLGSRISTRNAISADVIVAECEKLFPDKEKIDVIVRNEQADEDEVNSCDCRMWCETESWSEDEWDTWDDCIYTDINNHDFCDAACD